MPRHPRSPEPRAGQETMSRDGTTGRQRGEASFHVEVGEQLLIMGRRKISGIQQLPPLGSEHVATGVYFLRGRMTAELDGDRNYWLYDQLAIGQAETQRPVG